MGGLAAIASVPIGAKQEIKYVLWFVNSKKYIFHCMSHIS
jgi:hypothetical protein